jgi:hypothetical protein
MRAFFSDSRSPVAFFGTPVLGRGIGDTFDTFPTDLVEDFLLDTRGLVMSEGTWGRAAGFVSTPWRDRERVTIPDERRLFLSLIFFYLTKIN